jgi:hypothetical protein
VHQERRRERRAALEEERLDAVGGERLELVRERAGAELELGVLRERPTPEREAPRLSRHRDAARVQARRIGEHRPHSHRNRVDGGTELVHAEPRLLARDPPSAGDDCAAVHRDRKLQRHVRPAESDPRAPGLVLAARLRKVEELDLDAGRPQALRAPSGCGARVVARGDHARDARLDDALDARRRAALMRAGLHRHVERRAARCVSGRVERDHFRMPSACRLAHPFPQRLAARRDDHRPDGRVRIPAPRRRRDQREGPLDAHAAAAAAARPR